MKTKINFACVATVLMLLCSFASKAQLPNYVFNNNLNCRVTVFYEMRTNLGGPCGNCISGSLVLPPGTTVLPTCPGYAGMCLIITDIGGNAPVSNHRGIPAPSQPPCHALIYGQTGPSFGCNASGIFNVVCSPTLWSIN